MDIPFATDDVAVATALDLRLTKRLGRSPAVSV